MISYFLMFASVLSRARAAHGGLSRAARVADDRGADPNRPPRRIPAVPRDGQARRTRCLLHALPVMLALFVLFPRLPGPLWAIPGSTSSGATGLNDTMSPGDITNLGLSDEIAFRVEFEAAAAARQRSVLARPVAVATSTAELGRCRRGCVAASASSRRSSTAASRRAIESRSSRTAATGRSRSTCPGSWSDDRSLRMGSDYQLGTFFGAPRARRLDYRVTSYVDYSAREPLTEREREGSARCRRAATRARARWPRAGSPIDRAAPQIVERAMEYLRSQPFQYTLTPPALGSATRRRVPVRDARGLLRALRVGAHGLAARGRPAGARRHGLSRRRAQRGRRLLHRPPVRRARLDRSLARGRRLGTRRRRRGRGSRTRGLGLRPLAAQARPQPRRFALGPGPRKPR